MDKDNEYSLEKVIFLLEIWGSELLTGHPTSWVHPPILNMPIEVKTSHCETREKDLLNVITLGRVA